MYVVSVQEKLTAALQSTPSVTHDEFVKGLQHNERLGLLDTVREMQRKGLLRRDISERDADGKMVLRYVRIG
jgi:hypothetical protein